MCVSFARVSVQRVWVAQGGTGRFVMLILQEKEGVLREVTQLI